MLLVIDTNALVAALVGRGGSGARLIEAWRRGSFDVAVSDATLREAELVAGAGWVTKLSGAGSQERLLDELRTRAVRVEAPILDDLTLRDPGDRRLVECAFAAGADYLATADREVLLMRGYGPTEFLAPGEVVERLRAAGVEV